MMIYNVTSHMEMAMEKEWLEWIKDHIAQVLGTGLFLEAKLTRVLVEDQEGTSTFSVQYKTKDRESLQSYYKDHATALRKESSSKFGERVLAFRTELEVIDEYTVKLN